MTVQELFLSQLNERFTIPLPPATGRHFKLYEGGVDHGLYVTARIGARSGVVQLSSRVGHGQVEVRYQGTDVTIGVSHLREPLSVPDTDALMAALTFARAFGAALQAR